MIRLYSILATNFRYKVFRSPNIFDFYSAIYEMSHKVTTVTELLFLVARLQNNNSAIFVS
jgi:hypothetical protein